MNVDRVVEVLGALAPLLIVLVGTAARSSSGVGEW